MRTRLPSMLQYRMPPPLILGVVVAIVCLGVETGLAALLRPIAPVHSLGLVYLPGILVVASLWGLFSGVAIAVASALTFDYFLLPPSWSLLDKREDWAMFALFVIVAMVACLIFKLAHALAIEVDAHADADLAAGLARLLLRAPDLGAALPAAARYLTRALRLPPAAIELRVPVEDERPAGLPSHENSHENAVRIGSLLVPADLPKPAMRRLEERVVPSLQVLLKAARERERVGEALKASRDELRRIADEQAALRRLATLVAYGVPADEVFSAVAREVGQVLKARHTQVLRYEPDGAVTIVGTWNAQGPVATLPLDSRWMPEKGTVSELVARTGAPGRIDSLEGNGIFITELKNRGVASAAGCPITVGGRLWGTVIASSRADEPLPESSEERLKDFTELVAVAIANAQSHAELAASRARVVAAADQTRSRIERELQNGIQQHLAALALELGAIREKAPPGLREQVSHTAQTLQHASGRLREISRGLHPAFLARSGLQPALRALARRSPTPVELTVDADRRAPERFELAAYHIVEEALTNAVQQTQVSVVHVDVTVKETVIRFSIRDDGPGGATPGRRSELVGLTDRAAALGGRVQIGGLPGGGVSITGEIPIGDP